MMKTYKEKLYQYEERPPEDVWDNIQNEINTPGVHQLPERKTVKWMAFATSAAAIIVLLLLNFIFFNKTNIKTNGKNLAGVPLNDSIKKNNHLLDSIINAPEDKKLLIIHEVATKDGARYFVVEGEDGQPVKISSKVAALILSADNEYPPKPVWNKKIDKWQKIMLSSNSTATTASLLDVIQQATNSVE